MLVEWLWQVKESVDRHGIRWGLIFAFYAILRKERRNYRLDKRDEIHNASFVAILKNQQLLLEKMGVKPCADTLTLIEHLSAQTQNGGYMSLWPEKLRARYAARKAIWSFIIWNIRRSIMIKSLTASISKKLAAFVIAAVITALNHRYGLELNADAIYGLYGLTIAYILGQSHVDAKKALSNAVNTVATSISDAAAMTDGSPISTITTPPMSYAQVKPYLDEVSNDMSQIYQQLSSGRHTDEIQRAQNIAITIHDYLQKCKGA